MTTIDLRFFDSTPFFALVIGACQPLAQLLSGSHLRLR